MEEETNCLLIRYCESTKNESDYWNDYYATRCYVLNEIYSDKFTLKPINILEISGDSFWNGRSFMPTKKFLQLHSIEKISKKTYDEINRLYLTYHEDDLKCLLDK